MMSLKLCNKLVPQLFKCLKQNNTFIYRPVFNGCKRKHETCLISSFNSNNRWLSFKSNLKDTEKDKHTIYYGYLTPQIRAVKIFSLSSSLVGILAQPFLYKEIAASGNVPIIIAAYSFIGFFTIVTPMLLHVITKKYITHLEYKPDTDSYIARTVNFFCLARETEFKPAEVHVPEVPGMFTTFCAKGKALFLDPRSFEYPEHYAKIMGYDKPIDFKLNENSPDDKQK